MVLKKQTLNRNTAADVKPLPKSFCVLDLETTGFDPETDKIIEIGCVRFNEGEIVGTINFMVNQDIETLKSEITEMTGHTLEDVKRGVPEDIAITVLNSFMMGEDDRLPIVGQNILFDFEFYVRARERTSLLEPIHDLYDTLTIGRDRKQYPHRLGNLCKTYGVELTDWHSAINDATATGYLFLAMHEEDKKLPKDARQVADYKNVIGYKRQYGVPSWFPSWVEMRPQGNITTDENKKTVENIIEKAEQFVTEDIKNKTGKFAPKKSFKGGNK